MNPEDLFEASYRGAEFFMSRSALDGGRKDAKKSFANSNRQLVEDLGLAPRVFTLDGTIAARRNNEGAEIASYLQVRKALLDALELGGPGVLIHPFYGRLENRVARTFSLGESTAELGDGRISITFEVSDTEGIPEASTDVLSAVAAANDAVTDTYEATITDDYEVTPTDTGNFPDAVDKLTSFKEAVEIATSPIAAAAAKIDAFNNTLSDFQTDITSLIVAPTDLSLRISEIFDGVNGLYLTVDGTLTAFENLFDFGDLDVRLGDDTKARIERQRNRDLINYATQASALSHSYLAAAQVVFQTIEEIEETADRLELQYQKLVDALGISGELIQSLTEARTTTQLFFDQQKLVARQIITVDTNPISTRGLAFQYYGSSDLGREIGELNMLADPTLVQGDVRIFTE